jgi:hypothetical protein
MWSFVSTSLYTFIVCTRISVYYIHLLRLQKIVPWMLGMTVLILITVVLTGSQSGLYPAAQTAGH